MKDLCPDLPGQNSEELSELQTLVEIVERIKGRLPGAGARA